MRRNPRPVIIVIVEIRQLDVTGAVATQIIEDQAVSGRLV